MARELARYLLRDICANPVGYLRRIIESEEFASRHSIFKGLYHQRWGIEEDYKTMKCRLEIENRSGKSIESIYQDFHANLFTDNFTAVLAHPTHEAAKEKPQSRRYDYQINFTHALSKMKDNIVLLFKLRNPIGLIRLLHELFILTVEPVRPGRIYPGKRRKRDDRFHLCYKPIS